MLLPSSAKILFAAGVLLAILFGVWAMLALRDGPLREFDKQTALAMKDAAAGHHARRAWMIAFTLLGGIRAMTLLAVAGAVWQWWRGDRTFAIAWVAIAALGGLFDLALKKSFDRPRPPAEWRDEAVHQTNESFPSGHSMGSMVGYGTLGYAILCQYRRRGLMIVVPLGVLAMVGLIGFSRIYLRAHWFSDVIGGYLIGAAWLALGLACLCCRERPTIPK